MPVPPIPDQYNSRQTPAKPQEAAVPTPENAAKINAAGTAVDANGQPIAAQPVNPFPVSHVPREKGFDDREIRIIQGRMWLISFTDLFSILLCFFILMYSMKEPNFEKISKVLGNTDGAGYAGAGTGQSLGDQAGASIDHVEYGEALDLSYLQGVLKKALEDAGVQNDVKLVTARDHLKLIVDDASGENGEHIAKQLGERLTLLSNRITVVGMPARWSSGDWPGSMATAANFAAQMKDGGYRKRLTVIGEGISAGHDIEIRVENDDGRIQ